MPNSARSDNFHRSSSTARRGHTLQLLPGSTEAEIAGCGGVEGFVSTDLWAFRLGLRSHQPEAVNPHPEKKRSYQRYTGQAAKSTAQSALSRPGSLTGSAMTCDINPASP